MTTIMIPMIPSAYVAGSTTDVLMGGYACADRTFVGRERIEATATKHVFRQLPGTQVWSPPV